MQKLKFIGKLLLGEKYVHGRKRKINAKFSGHYVRPGTYNTLAHALRLHQKSPHKILNNKAKHILFLLLLRNKQKNICGGMIIVFEDGGEEVRKLKIDCFFGWWGFVKYGKIFLSIFSPFDFKLYNKICEGMFFGGEGWGPLPQFFAHFF